MGSQFAVAYVSLFDYELIVEVVCAKDRSEAIWKHSKLDMFERDESTVNLSYDDLCGWFFDTDVLVAATLIQEDIQKANV